MSTTTTSPTPQSPQLLTKSGLFLDSEVSFTGSTISIGQDQHELTASLTTTPDHSNISISQQQQHDITIDKVLEMIYAIADIGSPSIKIYLFRLNKYLQDQQVLTLFVERNGIDQLEKCIKELRGNALTYAYSCLRTMSLNANTLKSFPTRIIDVIIQRFSIDDTLKENTLKSMLMIIKRCLGEFQDKTFKAIGVINKENKVLAKLVKLLKSTDVDLQVNTISLINAIMSSASDAQHLDTMLGCFEYLDIFVALKKLNHGVLGSQKDGLLSYQKSIMRSINHQRLTLFEKDPTSFINMYNRYKQSLLPPGHSTEEWKHLGFHTEEPYQEFKTVGILGLTNLLYFFDTYPSIIKKIYTANQKRRDNQCYPFSAIAITLTHLVNQSLLIGEDPKNLKFVPLLFSHYHAVQELFCFIFQVFENSWLDVNADINKILALVKKQLTNVLDTKKTIFDAMNMLTQRNRDISLLEQPVMMTKSPDMIVNNTSMNNLGQSIPTTAASSMALSQKDVNDSIGSISKLNHTDIYKSINQIVKNNIIESFKNNKTNILLKGLFFKVEKNYKLKGGVSGGSFIFIRLSNDLKQFSYTFTNDTLTVPTKDFIGTMNLQDIQISTNISNLVESSPSQSSNQPSRKNKGKVDNSSTLLYLSNVEKESDSSTWLELSSTSRESLVDLVDGHKVLNRQSLVCSESIEELAALEEIEMKVNMLDFVGVDSFISDTAPPIPTLPSDFDFFELKLKDYHSQFTNHGKQSSSINNNNNNNNNTSAATTTTRKKLVHRSVRQSMYLMQGIKDEIQQE
ncbi:hypothetical protein DFA_00564 [Cavenderia fasciculata]|uniref:ELMO domain-containing protein n=1 Tax=Cavenderia fasciculata TaxID=261658 RepID=F4PSL1_CACFS|nr:uncharacterized protein DFA_00564 [Cavenderia fasciculata]EGG20703.1 hypothetical protein DFA_00564 [Cavenderia fasciculata]|eukprot:XP_004358553.1 hypothetical protein DFA_00564 [Cavenderia fasciculata]